MDDMPDDPFSGLADMSASIHEWFITLMKGGFTERQALYLIGSIIGTMSSNPKDDK